MLFLLRNNGYLAVTFENSEFDRFQFINPMVLPGRQQDIIDRNIDELDFLIDDSTIFHHDNRRAIKEIFRLGKFFLNITK